ncbi:MAG TPA: peroxiredoxin, partial [Thermoanaerobaculia bacterium]|nr:peroxiredoxin [Thermoanaerobaculia bacterium]
FRPPAVPNGKPTFNREVVRIFQQNCQSCHHPGDIAPFSLMTYADAFPYRLQIKLMTQSREMPPWKATAGCGEFDAARVLSTSDIETIKQWVDGGAPEGSKADMPPALQFTSSWTLGQPDMVLSSPEPYTPPATGDIYRCFTLPTNLPADSYVSAIDIHPGDRETVHHVIAYIDTTGDSVALDEKDPGPGYTSFGGPGFAIVNANAATLGGWVPGARPFTLPDGIAYSLPANSRVVLQVHYHPHHGQPLPDRTEIGIYFAKKKPKQLLRILPVINQTFTIPPNNANYEVKASFPIPVPVDTHLWIVAPHMHLLGRKMKVEATLPNGSKQCLINIDDWDFNWQGMYLYKGGLAMPAFTRYSLTAYYDNSDGNFRNPNSPPKAVSWGEQTTDEMCIAFLGITFDAEDLTRGKVMDASWMLQR